MLGILVESLESIDEAGEADFCGHYHQADHDPFRHIMSSHSPTDSGGEDDRPDAKDSDCFRHMADAPEEAGGASQVVVDGHRIIAAAPERCSTAGVKRKREECNPLTRDELDAEDQTPTASAVAAVPRAAVREEYYKPMEKALQSVHQLLRDSFLSCHAELETFVDWLQSRLGDLRDSTLVSPCLGLITAPRVVDLIQSEVLDRHGHSEYLRSDGLCEWAQKLGTLLEGWCDIAEGDRAEKLEDVAVEMEDHAAMMGYCLESLQELVEEEDQNQEQNRCAIATLMRHRLSASLASRRW
jgi:hypothetical protein